ncbi:MAG: threonine ammonia-lyase IlvA [Acidobacteria bacterium]|nr:threonine ammonia-lyase IlvA [Acidobacteriota bacterium]MCB9398804.1 threonine ammonia-lyase IlvA [Acidobacteriota bacterium]
MTQPTTTTLLTDEIIRASQRLKALFAPTPLQKSLNLSQRYGCELYLKREDLHRVRSYKIRGAYNLIQGLTAEELAGGVVCASAGNHAQGVAFSCHALQVRGVICMPTTTPGQKVTQVRRFGQDQIEVILHGDTFDDCYHFARNYAEKNGGTFVHPFDDWRVIEGQATVGIEILEQMTPPPDVLILPIGGGGLAAGVGFVMGQMAPESTLIGVEPKGAASMKASIEAGRLVTLPELDKFVDGAAVRRVGEKTFPLVREHLSQILTVDEGHVCVTILQLYNEDAIVVEPAGALSVASLDLLADQIRGKRVVCVVSGGNNDIDRMQEIKERALLYQGLKHYVIVNFAQRAGALKEFVNLVLGPTDDITRFEYFKKNNRETGPALVGIEVQAPGDFDKLVDRMRKASIPFTLLNEDPDLFRFLV